jgi:hypothetical protein
VNTASCSEVVPQLCRQYGNKVYCTDCFSFEGNNYCWTHMVRIRTLFWARVVVVGESEAGSRYGTKAAIESLRLETVPATGGRDSAQVRAPPGRSSYDINTE